MKGSKKKIQTGIKGFLEVYCYFSVLAALSFCLYRAFGSYGEGGLEGSENGGNSLFTGQRVVLIAAHAELVEVMVGDLKRKAMACDFHQILGQRL